MRLSALRLALAAIATTAHAAASVEYVTDLPAYSLLAECASAAISYPIQVQTYVGSCDDDRPGLQSCICQNATLSAEVLSSIRDDVSASCGSTASGDQSSAEAVWDQYCDPDKTVDFSTPSKNIVSAYITDLSEMRYLAPCASTGLSSAVMAAPLSKCPAEPSLYAPCVCSKDGVADMVSRTISKSVSASCFNDEDVTLAYDFFSHYCDMNQGTTSFPTPTGPPGDMSYHVTALPQYASLNDCAQSAVSYAIMGQTIFQCPEDGPQALASCVCIKDGMSRRMSSTLTSDVRWYCDVTATADVSSALDILDYYCSAARDEVTAQVTVSTSESAYPTAESGTTSSTPPGETGTSGDDNSSGDDQNSTSTSTSSSSNGGDGTSKTAVIAGSVIGGLVLIVAIVALIWFIRRRKMRASTQEQVPSAPPSPQQHAELHGATSLKDLANRKELGDSYISELPPQTRTNELPAQGNAARTQHFASHELESPSGGVGGGFTPSAPTRRAAGGMGWQSGPMDAYEMDATPRGR
ncbi:uncharacterized protein J7T54_003098 [Emericellopsis cladophorae]|uniref:Extracellular membrane protein CFEM domain-containing protein n=1 Tax=Emericellopsis cladophorae TaxID=2686198 RepID=A0A9P9XZY0_9HYPO|nr:uncharacterized protein J7T54_003098 [Emericellopsis cladophorae]KAI6780956.1 hypothetical protein J7T54_003098 [Emericellopsis cladophorae]